MKFLLMVVFSLLIGFSQAALSSASGAENSNEEFIQGTWRIDGYLNQKERRGRWFQEVTFEDGKFKWKGYPMFAQSGSYRVLSDEGDKLTLELYEQQGTFGTKNSRLEIIVNRQKDQLKIRNNEPFLRVKPKS